MKYLKGLLGLLFVSKLRALFCFFLATFFFFNTYVFAALPGTIIQNQAKVDFKISSTSKSKLSNTHEINTTVIRTPSTLRVYRYTTSSGDFIFDINRTFYSNNGTETGTFLPMNDPVLLGGSILDLSNPIEIIEEEVFSKNEPIFLVLTDLDQNIDITKKDTVFIALTTDPNGANPQIVNPSISPSIVTFLDAEYIKMVETDVNTGMFVGYIQTTDTNTSVGDGQFFVEDDTKINATYIDVLDSIQVSADLAVIEPFSTVFSSSDGIAVSGLNIDLLQSGSVVQSTTSNTLGQYRFTSILAGDYTLRVSDPNSIYSSPSSIPSSSLSAFGYSIDDNASYELPFTQAFDGAMRIIDIPVDEANASSLWITKSASKDKASPGEFVKYTLQVSNNGLTPISSIEIIDNLPRGLKYQVNSSKKDGVSIGDPSISGSGLTLTYTHASLASGASVSISYVVEVGAVSSKKVFNEAYAKTATINSNTASHELKITQDLFSDGIIVGRVYEKKNPKIGLKGAKVYLQNGRYALTDKNGKYHFEGINLGTHVVQLDLESIDGYKIATCTQNSRYAGRNFSKFVKIRRGGIKRVDFCAKQTKEHAGIANVNVSFDLEEFDKYIAKFAFKIDKKDVKATSELLYITIPEGSFYVIDSANVKPTNISKKMLIFRVPANQDEVTFEFYVESFDSNSTFGALYSFKDEKGKRIKSKKLSIDLVDDDLSSKVFEIEVEENSLKLDGSKNILLNVKDNTKDASDTIEASVKKVAKKEYFKIPTKQKKMPDFDFSTLSSDFKILWPPNNYIPPIASIKISVLHKSTDKLKLFLNDKEVDIINFDTVIKNSDKSRYITRYSGVDLRDGDNYLKAQITRKDGSVKEETHNIHVSTAPVEAKILEDKSYLKADGKNSPVIAVQFFDKHGYAMRSGMQGVFSIDAPYTTQEQEDRIVNDPLGINQSGSTFKIHSDGIAYIKLKATSTSGEVRLNFNLDGQDEVLKTWLTSPPREWILVGFGEGTIGHKKIKDNLSTTGVDDGFYKDGTLSFFGKGVIKGDVLLTIAYDSSKNTKELYEGDIDPKSYYSVYADKSSDISEANSKEKLYLKLEKNNFYALFGDFDTGLTKVDLLSYSRSLNGVKSEYHGDMFSYNFFASNTNQVFIKDEIQGDGTSGLYNFSRKDILINSEKISIEVRDRFELNKIISTTTLSRFSDYDIDYDAGTIFFRDPVFSTDPGLNPQFIVAQYEVTGSSKNYTFGGRGAVKIFEDAVEIGATYVSEDLGTQSGVLSGVDLTWDINKNFQFQAQLGRTKNETNKSVSASAYDFELEYRGDKLKSDVFIERQSGAFGLNQQSFAVTDTQRYGFNMNYIVDDHWGIDFVAFKEEDLITTNSNSNTAITTSYRSDDSEYRLGYRLTTEKDSNSSTDESQITASWLERFLDNRLRTRVDYEVSIKDNTNEKYPNKTTFGVDYSINSNIDLFALYEISRGSTVKFDKARVGTKSRLWKGASLSSSIDSETGDNGNIVSQSTGVAQRVNITDNLLASFGIDFSNSIKNSASTSVADFTSYSTSLNYKEEDWIYAIKAEYRDADEDKINLDNSIYTDLTDALALAFGFGIKRSYQGGITDTTDLTSTLAFAYRPDISKWTILNRFDYVDSKDDVTSIQTSKFISNTALNYLEDTYEVSFNYGIKFVEDNIDGISYDSIVDLVGVDFIYDLSDKWDIGFHTSLLHAYDANQLDYQYGLSTGYNVAKNAWMSVGYNFSGFEDDDFSLQNYRYKGPYIKARFKFDQENLKDVLQWF